MRVPDANDAKHRSRVRCPDGTEAVLTYCPPPARWESKRKSSRPNHATVRLDNGHYAHFRPEKLVLLSPRRGDRVKLTSPAGQVLRGVFVESDEVSVTIIKDSQPEPSRIPRAILKAIEVTDD